jgi:beta-N-acetylhexosaminidase
MATPSERLAGLIMTRLDADRWSDESYRLDAYRLIDAGVGGFGIFAGSLEDTLQMIRAIQERAEGRLLLAADFEHGLPMRIREGGIAYPRAMALGRTKPGITEHLGQVIGTEMRALGVHWNWSPVADVNSDPLNPVINVRAFGENAEVVADHAAAMVKGLQKSGVLACAKHVPGHGQTSIDSHVDLPVVEAERELLESREFVPFKACIQAGVGSLMMGHLLIPALDQERPASLSPSIVNDIVRRDWGFDGLITTDALDMKAVTSTYTAERAAVLAVEAGCDVVLLPEDFDKALSGLEEAYANGRISEERLRTSEDRWKVVRERYTTTVSQGTIDQNAHAMMALKAADAAIMMEGDRDLLPISRFDHVTAFAVVDEREMTSATTFFHYLAQATEVDLDTAYIDGTMSDADLQDMKEATRDTELFIFCLFTSAVAYRGSLPGLDNIPRIMEQLSAGRPSIIVACGSPYGAERLDSSLKLFTFSDTTPSIAASVLRLVGRGTEQ